MHVMDLSSNTQSALHPNIRETRTGLELEPHEVDRIARPAKKKKLTEADQEWDEPLQSNLTKEAGVVLEEEVLMVDITSLCSKKLFGGRGRPELHGW